MKNKISFHETSVATQYIENLYPLIMEIRENIQCEYKSYPTTNVARKVNDKELDINYKKLIDISDYDDSVKSSLSYIVGEELSYTAERINKHTDKEGFDILDAEGHFRNLLIDTITYAENSVSLNSNFDIASLNEKNQGNLLENLEYSINCVNKLNLIEEEYFPRSKRVIAERCDPNILNYCKFG